jgi:hypothetical protein
MPVGMGMSDGPCALFIDECLFDGGELHVAWTAKSESRDTVFFSAGDLESPSVKLLHHGDTESLFDLRYELRPDGKPPAAQISNERNSGDTGNGRARIEFDFSGDLLPAAPSTVLLEAYRYPKGYFSDSEDGDNEPVRAPEYDIALKLKKTP